MKFPELVHMGMVKIPYSNDEVPLCCLDWDALEAHKRRKFEGWAEKHWPEQSMVYVPSFPPGFEEDITSLAFAIPDAYMSEISRTKNMALCEWSIRRPFDTVIREMCLRPAEAFIMVHFKLLADCIYDSEAGSYDRSNLQYKAGELMAYTFWCHQTGRGLLSGLSDLKHLEWLRSSEPIFAQRIANSIAEHYRLLDAQSPKLTEEVMSTAEVSLAKMVDKFAEDKDDAEAST